MFLVWGLLAIPSGAVYLEFEVGTLLKLLTVTVLEIDILVK